MKRPAFLFFLTLTLLLVSASLTPAKPLAQETIEEGEVVRKIIERAETHYKAGLVLTLQGRATEGRKEFDAAVDTILEAGLEVDKYKYLKAYYLALVEKIYNAETRQTQDLMPDPPNRPPEAQGVCAIQNEGAIALRGFRIGDTVTEVRRRLPHFQIPPANRYGFTKQLLLTTVSRDAARDAKLQGVATRRN